VELREQGLTIRQIARKLDFSEQHVRRQLERHDALAHSGDRQQKSA
jgi:IS30 family transposase